MATDESNEWTPFAYSAAPKAISPEWKVVSSLCSFVSFVHWPAANRLKRGFRFKTAHVTKTAEPVTVHDSLEKLNRTGRNSQTFFPTCFCSGRQTSNSFFLCILTWTVWKNAIYNFISGDLLNWGKSAGFFSAYFDIFLLVVILGSSGKSIVGPMVPESGDEQIHRVQGFILKPDSINIG